MMRPNRKPSSLPVAIISILIWTLLIGCSSQSNNEENQLLVFSAASLTDSLSEVVKVFEEQNRVEVDVSYGGSQALAQQIASGAPADLFISAGQFPLSFLGERGMVEAEPLGLLSNKLVVVTRADGFRPGALEELVSEGVERVAVAEPELAPAGRYARESLTSIGIWDDLQDRIIMGADVRTTLAYVESGNADAALVYKTDAMIVDDLAVLDIVPEETYSQISYPAAIISSSNRKPLAQELLDFFKTETASEIFKRHGFVPLNRQP